jgi:SAM-dependent methyltransferase
VFENVVDELGIVGVTTDNVGFHQVRLPAESFDLAVFVDVFAYDSFDMSILSKVAAALRTAGIVIIKAANRWADRDAFTDIPGLNLLHRNTALSALDVLTGSHDVYANTRLMSPYDLVQLLEPRGFGDFRLQKDVPNSPYAGTIHTRFFYLAARRR